MDIKDLKCYYLMVAKTYPVGHSQCPNETGFQMLIDDEHKKHTVRKNYEKWKRQAKEINEGRAYLSLRIWEGKPRKSKQIEIKILTKIGVEGFRVVANQMYVTDSITTQKVGNELCYNDGLTPSNFKEWFADAFPQCDWHAIIHFTDFRYIQKNID